MPRTKSTENAAEQFVKSIEAQPIPGFESPAQPAQIVSQPIDREQVLANMQMNMGPAAQEKAKTTSNQTMSLDEAQEARRNEIREQVQSKGLGYLRINPQDLPTKGIFYEPGTEFFVRAATGGEIRHWSQTNETTVADVNDSLNYMLERCLSVKMPGRVADWRDLVEIDRFYMILCIRDFTFVDGNNELMITINENKQVPLKKDNIQFIDLGDKLMRFYNVEKRCFTLQEFDTKYGKHIRLSKPLDIYMPRLGVTEWLKNYVQRKQQGREMFDRDFISMAPLLVPDFRVLNDQTYSRLIADCDYFGPVEYSLIEQFKRVIAQSVEPKFIYNDEEGVEQQAPLNFQGGWKNLFLETGLDELL